MVPVGIENEDALLVGSQAVHAGEYIDERGNPAKVAQ